MLEVVQAILYHTCWTYILIHVYTRGETTSGAKRLGGAKRPGGKRPGGKRLGGETTRGGNGLGAKRPGFPIDCHQLETGEVSEYSTCRNFIVGHVSKYAISHLII